MVFVSYVVILTSLKIHAEDMRNVVWESQWIEFRVCTIKYTVFTDFKRLDKHNSHSTCTLTVQR